MPKFTTVYSVWSRDCHSGRVCKNTRLIFSIPCRYPLTLPLCTVHYTTHSSLNPYQSLNNFDIFYFISYTHCIQNRFNFKQIFQFIICENSTLLIKASTSNCGLTVLHAKSNTELYCLDYMGLVSKRF